MSSGQGCASDLRVRAGDWPYGLRCGDCNRLLRNGERYAEQWNGMVGEFPAVVIVCRPCAAAHDHDQTAG